MQHTFSQHYKMANWLYSEWLWEQQCQWRCQNPADKYGNIQVTFSGLKKKDWLESVLLQHFFSIAKFVHQYEEIQDTVTAKLHQLNFYDAKEQKPAMDDWSASSGKTLEVCAHGLYAIQRPVTLKISILWRKICSILKSVFEKNKNKSAHAEGVR